MKTVAVIGSGIAGITAAYYLAKAGYKVNVYEQESYPAMKTSYANGGQISVSNSEVWTTWSNIVKAAKWITKKDAPLLIRPSLDWDKFIWLMQFLYHTAKNDHEKRTIETIKLGLEARGLYHEIIKNEGIRFDQTNSGILHIYKDQKYFDHAKKIQDLYESNGCEWQIVDANTILDIEPTLYKAKGIIGGAWTPSDFTGDIHKFCKELMNVLQTRYAVNFYFDQEIQDIVEFKEQKIVIANGIGSIKLAEKIGDRLPIYPVKGYSITIQAEDVKSFESMPKVSLLDDQAKIVTSKLGTRLRIAGTAEFAGENYDISRHRIDPLLNWVKENLPSVDRSNYTQWSCLRPMTPNMMPIIKSSTRASVYYHVGHGHLGWTLAPSTAKILVKLIDSN